jgi:hypothetical protein
VLEESAAVNATTQTGEKTMDRIEHHQGGSTSLVGRDAVEVLRLAALKSGLEFEMRCPGMKLTRGVNCRKLAKELTGLKTNDRAKLAAAVQALIDKQHEKVLHVDLTTGGEDAPGNTGS